jgi:hypothetical protein
MDEFTPCEVSVLIVNRSISSQFVMWQYESCYQYIYIKNMLFLLQAVLKVPNSICRYYKYKYFE